MIVWDCVLCKKRYIQRGRLVRHLASVHRKSTNAAWLVGNLHASAETVAEKGKTEFTFIAETEEP